MRTSRIVVALVIAVAVVAALAAAMSASASAPPIKLGAVLSITGPGASLGVEEARALALKTRLFNRAGGIKGRKVQIKIVDDQSSPDKAVQATRALLADFRPNAIIGGSISATCQAMRPVTEAARVVQYCLSAAPIAYPAPYYFSAQSPFARWIGDVPIYWMVQSPKKGFSALIYLHRYTRDTMNRVLNGYLREYEVKLRNRIEHLALVQTSDATSARDKIGARREADKLTKLRSNGVGAIYVCTTGAGVVTALNGIRQLGINVPIWISSGSASLPIAHLIKGILPPQGAYTAGAKIQVVDSLPKTDRQRPFIVAFSNAYKKAYKEPADIFSATGADVFNILTRAVAGAGVGASGGAIAQYMVDKIRLTGVQLNYHFRENDHRGTDLDGIVDKFTSAGGFAFVADYAPAKIPRYAEK